MNVPGSVVRAELRRGRTSLLALAALVAVVVAAVATSLAGAHRTTTSVDRFRTWANASDGNLQLDDPSQIDGVRRELRASRVVEGSATRLLVNAFLEHRPITDIALYSDPDGRYGRTVDRARVLHGRMPRAGEHDTIALTELAADLLHVGPGAVLRAHTWSTADLDALTGDQDFPGFHGPRLHLRVVGVVRTLDGLTADVARASPYGFVGPDFVADHPDIGVWPPALYVRTRGGAAGFEALGGYLRRHGPHSTGTPATDLYVDAAQRAADDAATGLVVFAIAAALAAAFVVGQAISRHLLLGASDLRQLVVLGMTRTQAATVGAVPVVGATAIGTALGTLAAVALSAILPIGLAGRAEPHPGIRVDLPILLACVAASLLVVTVFALLTGRAALGRVGRPVIPARHASVLGRLAGRLGVRPAVGVGVHLAVERRAPGGPVPVRSALAVGALAVAAVVGASVVAHSESAFAAETARWGRTWHSEPDAFDTATSHRTIERAVLAEPGVAAAAFLSSDSLRVNGHDIPASAMTPVRGRLTPAVRTGRLPRRVDEIAVGEGSLRAIDTHVGGTVRVAGQDHATTTQTMTVTGTVVTPPSVGSSGVLDTGVVVTDRALRTLIPPGKVTTSDIVLTYRPDVDVGTVERRLERHGLDFNPFTEPQTPGVVRQLSDTRTIAIALGWFFLVLGLLGLLHALWVAARRHRREFAVLRVIGMRRRQITVSLVAAALLLTAAAVAVGIPVGIAVGRLVWHGTTDSLHALTDPVTPWVVVLLAVPVTLALGALLAAWPARRAGHDDLATALRSE